MPSRPPTFVPSNKPSQPIEQLRKKEFDKTRSGSSARGYGWKWQKARKKFLSAHPICVVCEAKGKVKAAIVVDHIIPHKGRSDLFWNEQNWQPMCTPCHSSKTAREDSSFASGDRGGKSLPPPPSKTAYVDGFFGARNAKEKGS